jgi:hypothetical protein
MEKSDTTRDALGSEIRHIGRVSTGDHFLATCISVSLLDIILEGSLERRDESGVMVMMNLLSHKICNPNLELLLPLPSQRI